MPATPTKQTGYPQHGQFDVLVNRSKYAAHGNRNRFVVLMDV